MLKLFNLYLSTGNNNYLLPIVANMKARKMNKLELGAYRLILVDEGYIVERIT